MKLKEEKNNIDEILHELGHYLPSQSPLKDFIHHNTLHAFQHRPFHEALHAANQIFGFKVYLQLHEYRKWYHNNKIPESHLIKIISKQHPTKEIQNWLDKLLRVDYDTSIQPRLGKLRSYWKSLFKINLDKITHPILLRLLSNYLDQGIAIRKFPVISNSFIQSIRELEKNSFHSLFLTDLAKSLLLNEETTLSQLLHLLVGDESLNLTYLFDQQFAHPGWSGMVNMLEQDKNTLLDKREISLHDLIFVECLLEIDALENKFEGNWSPLSAKIQTYPEALFSEIEEKELNEVYAIWQECYEWNFYQDVLTGIKNNYFNIQKETTTPTFQALLCIDDRECSFRRHLEHLDPNCKTYGTPGFFNVAFYFQPEHGKFYTKVCPAPLFPKYLIKELDTKNKRGRDAHLTHHSHSLFLGYLISQSLGFWSAIKLFLNIFKPSVTPATSYSFRHMDPHAALTIENTDPTDPNQMEGDLQIGFTVSEMADRVEGLLKSIGLVENFAPIIYAVGHGASSVNNTHYAGYDCGACSGRPGSVNARVISYMGNHPEVRKILAKRGIYLPEETRFIGAMHDTTRDEIEFYDEKNLHGDLAVLHAKNRIKFLNALDYNAKERSRRFELTYSNSSPAKVHEKIKLRSVSLFEPRPELNHATNCLCIVGRRSMTEHLFLDRRAFLNSYDYQIDPNGDYLLNILNAAAPVCGGINLEYYFSRVDNHKLGAGSKLPHNVMGLIGVANGADGDLRPGLPLQMIEVHDPLRLLMVVEHFPEIVLKTIMRNDATFEWFKNNWIHLVAIHPKTGDHFLFDYQLQNFVPMEISSEKLKTVKNMEKLFETEIDNIPVMQWKGVSA